MARTCGEAAELSRLDQIPQGMTEDETDAFWETHSLGDKLLDQMEPFPEDFPLPPRAEDENRQGAEQDRAGQTFPAGKILISLAALGIAAVTVYAAYRLLASTAGIPNW